MAKRDTEYTNEARDEGQEKRGNSVKELKPGLDHRKNNLLKNRVFSYERHSCWSP